MDQSDNAVKKNDLYSNPMLDPELVGSATKAVAFAIKAGVLNFAKLISLMKERFGEQFVRKVDPILKAAWDGVREDYDVPGMDAASDVSKILDALNSEGESVTQKVKTMENPTLPVGEGWIELNPVSESTMALENLEQMQPRLLASLLRSGGLKSVLEQRTSNYFKMMGCDGPGTADSDGRCITPLMPGRVRLRIDWGKGIRASDVDVRDCKRSRCT